MTAHASRSLVSVCFKSILTRPPQSVQTALEIGYRHIDTAEMYENEEGVGQGIRDAGVDRAEVYITSKLNNGFHKPDDARRAFDATLEALGSDYVDLFLIHWPLPTLYDGDFVSTWQTLEEFKTRRPRPQHRRVELPGRPPERLAARDRRPCRRSTRSRCTRTSPTTRCAPTAQSTASPPRRGRRSPRARCSTTRSSSEIAEADGRTPAQVVLRWHIQRGDIVFPKSVTPQRIKENFELFDFELDDAGWTRCRHWTRARRVAPARTPTVRLHP